MLAIGYLEATIDLVSTLTFIPVLGFFLAGAFNVYGFDAKDIAKVIALLAVLTAGRGTYGRRLCSRWKVSEEEESERTCRKQC